MTRNQQIADAYYNSPDSLGETARKFRISFTRVSQIASEFEPYQFVKGEPEEPKEMSVIKVESRFLPHVLELLERRGIECEAPEKYELLEFMESKMNSE